MTYKEPLSYYLKDGDKALQFHVIKVGQGLMILLIFPDKTTMLFDCFVTEDNEEYVMNYLKNYIPTRKNEESEEQWIDIFVNSHRDKDHYQGLKKVVSEFEVKSVWDSGQYGSGAKSKDVDYEYYMDLKREIKDKYGEESVPKLTPSSTAFKEYGGAQVYCLNSKEKFKNECDIEEECSSKINYLFNLNEACGIKYEDINELSKSIEWRMLLEAKQQHTNCIVLSIRYGGKGLLLTGDSDWKCWKEDIIPSFKDSELLKSEILIASHHGSRTFFTENDTIDLQANPNTTYIEHMDYINPIITLISCGPYSTHHHPNEEAVKIYKEYCSNEQVYDTEQKESGFVGFISEDGYWSVMGSEFENYRTNNNLGFNIECIANKNGKEEKVYNGDTIDIGSKLQFKANQIKGMADNLTKEDIVATWEVTNGGREDDEEHQEIYFCGKSKKKVSYSSDMNRDLIYKGIHLTRCTIKNNEKNLKITKVFSVKGV